MLSLDYLLLLRTKEAGQKFSRKHRNTQKKNRTKTKGMACGYDINILKTKINKRKNKKFTREIKIYKSECSN